MFLPLVVPEACLRDPVICDIPNNDFEIPALCKVCLVCALGRQFKMVHKIKTSRVVHSAFTIISKTSRLLARGRHCSDCISLYEVT